MVDLQIETLDKDELTLAKVGHKQQLTRRFNIWTMFALSLCLLATWEALSATIISSLLAGGPVSVIYGFLLAWFGTLAQSASLAEISSLYPTAGGQYHWSACLSPPKISQFTSYIVGWASCVGLIATTASAAFAGALQVEGLVVLCHPGYSPQPWLVVIVFWAILLVAGLMNLFGVRLLPAFSVVSSISI